MVQPLWLPLLFLRGVARIKRSTPIPFSFMASDNLDIPHISIVGVPHDDNPSFSFSLPSPSLDSPCFEQRPNNPNSQRYHSPSPKDNHANLNGHLSSPIPVLRSARDSPDVSGSLSHASDNSSPLPHPSQTYSPHSSSICWMTKSKVSRDNTPSPHVYRRKRRKRSLTGSAHSDVTNAFPSTHSGSDGDGGSRSTNFFKRTVHSRRSSSSPRGESRETDTGSVTTRNDVLKGDIVDQSTVLDNLEGRLEAAKKLHGDSVDLQMLYESGTVATIKDLRMTGKQVPCYLQRQSTEYFSGLPRPLPQDNALFNEVDMLLVDIRQLYEELNMFWKEEIRQVAEFLKRGRTDPRYFERWNTFRSNLEQTIESWKVCFLRLYYAFSRPL